MVPGARDLLSDRREQWKSSSLKGLGHGVISDIVTCQIMQLLCKGSQCKRSTSTNNPPCGNLLQLQQCLNQPRRSSSPAVLMIILLGPHKPHETTTPINLGWTISLCLSFSLITIFLAAKMAIGQRHPTRFPYNKMMIDISSIKTALCANIMQFLKVVWCAPKQYFHADRGMLPLSLFCDVHLRACVALERFTFGPVLCPRACVELYPSVDRISSLAFFPLSAAQEMP